MGLPILTRGIPRGACRGLVDVVARLGRGIGWDSPVVWFKSEPIYPASNNVSGECAELKRAIKFVDDLERACLAET